MGRLMAVLIAVLVTMVGCGGGSSGGDGGQSGGLRVFAPSGAQVAQDSTLEACAGEPFAVSVEADGAIEGTLTGPDGETIDWDAVIDQMTGAVEIAEIFTEPGLHLAEVTSNLGDQVKRIFWWVEVVACQ